MAEQRIVINQSTYARMRKMLDWFEHLPRDMYTIARRRRQLAGSTGSSVSLVGYVVAITGLHSDSPVTGVRVYTGKVYPTGYLNGNAQTGVTIIIPLAANVTAPSYQTWANTPPFMAVKITHTWTGASQTHTDDIVYEAYPGQLMI